VLSHRVTLDVPFQLAVFVSRLLAGHRRELGTRNGARALTCWKQAVFALAWFRDRPDIRRLGAGFGISQATAYRYKDEAVDVLAAKAPTLREALERAVEQGLPYLILDGTLIASDRCADKKTTGKGRRLEGPWDPRPSGPPAGPPSYPDAKIATANGASRRSAPAINPDESSELGARLSTARGNQAASH
jgi:hypothetical protein